MLILHLLPTISTTTINVTDLIRFAVPSNGISDCRFFLFELYQGPHILHQPGIIVDDFHTWVLYPFQTIPYFLDPFNYLPDSSHSLPRRFELPDCQTRHRIQDGTGSRSRQLENVSGAMANANRNASSSNLSGDVIHPRTEYLNSINLGAIECMITIWPPRYQQIQYGSECTFRSISI